MWTFYVDFCQFMNVWNYETTYGRLEDEGGLSPPLHK